MKKYFLILLVFLLLILALYIWAEFYIEPNPWCFVTKNPQIERLEIWKYSEDEEQLIRTIKNPVKIAKYAFKCRWEDANAICCMEDTRYVFKEYIGEEIVGYSFYAGPFAGYHNQDFTLYQLRLILRL